MENPVDNIMVFALLMDSRVLPSEKIEALHSSGERYKAVIRRIAERFEQEYGEDSVPRFKPFNVPLINKEDIKPIDLRNTDIARFELPVPREIENRNEDRYNSGDEFMTSICGAI